MAIDPPKGSPEYFEKYPWARVEEPVLKKGGRDEDVYTHPAYGQLEIVRTSGHTVLYDSEFNHQHFITVRLQQSELHRNLGRDWHMTGHLAPLAEINMSEAQWATFVSAVGTGGGVPCTIRYVNNKHVPQLPIRKSEGIFRKEGNEALTAAVAKLKALRDKVSSTASKLSKKDLADLVGEVDATIRKLNDSVPYIAKMFDEHMEKVVEKAKAEVHGYVTSHVVRAGLDALSSPIDVAPALIEDKNRKR
jgi:hypothetical protein